MTIEQELETFRAEAANYCNYHAKEKKACDVAVNALQLMRVKILGDLKEIDEVLSYIACVRHK